VSSIGAHALAGGRGVVIANAGTALTIDGRHRRGRHRGGAIVPGPKVMVESLLVGTHGIRRRAQGSDASARTLFATDTASALAAGADLPRVVRGSRGARSGARIPRSARVVPDGRRRADAQAPSRDPARARSRTWFCAASPSSRGPEANRFATLAPRVRAALLLLLLANLAFFAWMQWLAPDEAQMPVSPKVNAPPLELVRTRRGPGAAQAAV
jgi:hypothetical protein